MRFLCAAVTAILLLPPWATRAQSPEDRYGHVYSLVEEADKLKDSGQARLAVTKYLEAQVAIKELQRAYPDWNTKLTAYRLEYISSHLEPLTQKVSAHPASGTADAGDPATSPLLNVTNQVKALQEEINRLSGQNALLEAKLREALTVQPAAVDPRELAKAEERIKQVQKERDLLAVSLEQSGVKGATVGAATSPTRDRETPTETKQNLVTQTAVVSVLRKQNEELQRQVSNLNAKLKSSGRDKEALTLKETIAALEASNSVMKEEQAAMEKRLLEFVRQHGAESSGRNGDLEKQLAEARQAAKTAAEERDALVQKLNAVTRELNQRDTRSPNPATQELERQLEAIRAKLQIFEAKQVPYSAEELALFKQASIPVAAAQTNAPPLKKKSPEVPAGARPLVAEARRAIDSGRFQDAEKMYRDVLRQDENNVFILANLAAVQIDQEKVADAEGTLKKALDIDPQDPASLYLMGSVRLRQDKFDEALEVLSLSAKIDPDKPQTQYFLGKALMHKGSRGPAETALRKAIQLKPGWGDAHYLLAVLYATQQPNFKELAQYHYKKAIAGGASRNLELEKRLEKVSTAAK
jgi:tetratricopeptide (TPR) repeat protein